MITVSVCMIVKNEERNLARCLDCLTDFADEIIIVDTGSTDKNKEIAANYTGKIYDFEWINDFAAARNHAFSFATMDYIYTADADEIIDKDNQKKLMQLKQALLPEIEIVQMYYANQLEYGTTYNYDRELRPKLFKRLRQFVWHDPVHETVVVDPVVYNSEIDIIHKPHEVHSKRDFATIISNINKGVEISKYLRTMYAKELFISGDDEDFMESYDYFRKLCDGGNLEGDELVEALCVVCHCANIKGDVAGLFKYSLKCIASSPCSEICNDIGEYYMSVGDYNEAYVWLYNAAVETVPVLSKKHGDYIPLSNLIKCCEEMGDREGIEMFLNERKKRCEE